MLFPIEIFSILVNELRADQSALACLGNTSPAIYSLIVPFLYENVHLSSTKSVECFCRTINRKTCHFGTRTRTLTLTNDLTLTKDVANMFRITLESMPNLKELHLDVQCEELDRCFEGLNAPFALQKLQIPVLASSAFQSFISSQPSITELQFKHTPSLDSEAVQEIFDEKPDVLPNLGSISASFEVLCLLISGRPVSEVMTLGEPKYDTEFAWQDSSHSGGDHVPEIWYIFRQSTIPITTTGFHSWPHLQDPWSQLVPALRLLDKHSEIKSFRIVEHFRDIDSDDTKRNALVRRINQLVNLRGFAQLEAVEVGLQSVRKPSKSQVLQWLGSMRTIVAWQKDVPSLRRVNMYGVNLE